MGRPSLDRPSWLTFPRFAGTTTGLTLALMTLGIYTAASGAGLACSAQWPHCDGGLLPQTLPSFVEWFHRLVAMIAGWFILGTALWAWRAGDRRARLAATLAVLLLPLQISVGAVTVTLSGALPRGYSAPTHATHLLVALAIFGLLVLTTLFAADGRGGDRGGGRDDAGGSGGPDRERRAGGEVLGRLRSTLSAGAVLLPLGGAFSRLTPLPYAPATQAVFYGLSLLAFAALLAGVVLAGRTGATRVRLLAGGALVLHLAHMLLGRDLVFYTDAVRALNAVVLAGAVALTALAAWLAHRRPDEGATVRGSRAAGD